MKPTLGIAAALCLAFSTVAAAEEAGDKLNDAKIATIALTAHTIDADRGKLAASRAHSDAVKELAKQMVNDHTSGRNEVLALAKKLHVTPEESGVSKSLKGDAAKSEAQLKKLKGAAFDKAYVDTEVAYHQAVIDAVTKVLIPNAQNAEVKQALENTVPTLQGHLVHAQQVQAKVAAEK